MKSRTLSLVAFVLTLICAAQAFADVMELGEFVHKGNGVWHEQGDDDDVRFEFVERYRDAWSVHLSDHSRGLGIQLNLWTRRVYWYPLGSGQRNYVYDVITPGDHSVRGWDVERVVFGQEDGCTAWDGSAPAVGSTLRLKNVVARDRTRGPSTYSEALAGRYMQNTLHGNEVVPKFTSDDPFSPTNRYTVVASRDTAFGPEVKLQSPDVGLAPNSAVGFSHAQLVTSAHSYWPIHGRWMRLAHTYRAWTDPDCGNCAATVNDIGAPMAVLQRVVGDDVYACSQNFSYGTYDFMACSDWYVSFGGYGGEENRHLARFAQNFEVQVCTP